jgi:hypothetical protein
MIFIDYIFFLTLTGRLDHLENNYYMRTPLAVSRRRTDNTMTKGKGTKNNLQSMQIKLKIEQHERQ